MPAAGMVGPTWDERGMQQSVQAAGNSKGDLVKHHAPVPKSTSRMYSLVGMGRVEGGEDDPVFAQGPSA